MNAVMPMREFARLARITAPIGSVKVEQSVWYWDERADRAEVKFAAWASHYDVRAEGHTPEACLVEFAAKIAYKQNGTTPDELTAEVW